MLIYKGGEIMPFNKSISGFENEREFYEYLNRKKVKEVNPIFRDLFETLYGSLMGEEVVYVTINYTKQKSDIYI